MIRILIVLAAVVALALSAQLAWAGSSDTTIVYNGHAGLGSNHLVSVPVPGKGVDSAEDFILGFNDYPKERHA